MILESTSLNFKRAILQQAAIQNIANPVKFFLGVLNSKTVDELAFLVKRTFGSWSVFSTIWHHAQYRPFYSCPDPLENRQIIAAINEIRSKYATLDFESNICMLEGYAVVVFSGKTPLDAAACFNDEISRCQGLASFTVESTNLNEVWVF